MPNSRHFAAKSSPKLNALSHSIAQNRGFSAWNILPWLLFFVLAACFWWFVNQHGARQEPITPQNVAPVVVAAPEPAEPVLVAAPVLSYHDAVEHAARSVVNIYTTQKINHPYADDPAFTEILRQYGLDVPKGETSLGSGVIVAADGYVLTNAHVIDKADEIVVALNDGRKAVASVVGVDVESDLAVIKVDLPDLLPIEFKKTAPRVGDVVLAIGNPFGVGQTVTQGIVSATGRSGLGASVFEDFIQTDAAINPGNSGGALVDGEGNLIGINTMIYSRSGGSMGLGFAIPNTIAQKVLSDIIQTGSVQRGWLGIEIGQTPENPVSSEQQSGVIVARVMANGPAAGLLMAGDVIVAIDGEAVNDAGALIRQVGAKSPNTPLELTVDRGGKKVAIQVVLAQRPIVGR